MQNTEAKNYIGIAAYLCSAIPIVWVSSMLIHDFSPDGLIRETLSSVLDSVFEYWQFITAAGVIGFFLAVIGFIKLRSYLLLFVGVIGLLVSVGIYGLIDGISRSGI